MGSTQGHKIVTLRNSNNESTENKIASVSETIRLQCTAIPVKLGKLPPPNVIIKMSSKSIKDIQSPSTNIPTPLCSKVYVSSPTLFVAFDSASKGKYTRKNSLEEKQKIKTKNDIHCLHWIGPHDILVTPSNKGNELQTFPFIRC